MKRENFVTLLLAAVGVILFGIGMCMCLLPEWNAFNQGVVVTAVGAVVLLALTIVNRVKSGKPAKKPNWKLVGKKTKRKHPVV